VKSAACLVLTAALTAVAVPVAPAAAADDAQQLDRVYLRYSGATRALRKWMSCEVAAQPEAARRLFDASFGSAEQFNATNTFFGPDDETHCLILVANRVRANGIAVLGTIAEMLMRKDAPAGTVRKLLPNPVAGGGSFTWTSGRVSSEQESMHIPVAYCLVDTQPAQMAELLATDETSNAERRLFNAMTGVIRNCMPNGRQQTLQPMFLRNALAIAYHYASRPVDASASARAANVQNAPAGER